MIGCLIQTNTCPKDLEVAVRRGLGIHRSTLLVMMMIMPPYESGIFLCVGPEGLSILQPASLPCKLTFLWNKWPNTSPLWWWFFARPFYFLLPVRMVWCTVTQSSPFKWEAVARATSTLHCSIVSHQTHCQSEAKRCLSTHPTARP